MNKVYFIYSECNHQFFHYETKPRCLKLTCYPKERKEYPTFHSAKDDLDMFQDMKDYSGFKVFVEEAHAVEE